MHRLMQYFFPAFCRYRLRTLFVVVSIAFSIFGGNALYGQNRDRITDEVNAAELVTCPITIPYGHPNRMLQVLCLPG
jgi:hypothetical protein